MRLKYNIPSYDASEIQHCLVWFVLNITPPRMMRLKYNTASYDASQTQHCHAWCSATFQANQHHNVFPQVLYRLLTNQPANFMEQSLSWKADSSSATQEIPPLFYGSRSFITTFTIADHLSLSSARLIHYNPSHPDTFYYYPPGILISSKRSLSFMFPYQNPVYISRFSCTHHIRYKGTAHTILMGQVNGESPLDKVLIPVCVCVCVCSFLAGPPPVFDMKLDPEDKHQLHGTLRTEHKPYQIQQLPLVLSIKLDMIGSLRTGDVAESNRETPFTNKNWKACRWPRFYLALPSNRSGRSTHPKGYALRLARVCQSIRLSYATSPIAFSLTFGRVIESNDN